MQKMQIRSKFTYKISSVTDHTHVPNIKIKTLHFQKTMLVQPVTKTHILRFRKWLEFIISYILEVKVMLRT